MTTTSTTYYAIANVGGPISIELDGESVNAAIAAFAELDRRAAIDSASTDAENALSIAGADMSEADFAAALETAGAKYVGDLEPTHNGHTGAHQHVEGSWTLWAV